MLGVPWWNNSSDSLKIIREVKGSPDYRRLHCNSTNHAAQHERQRSDRAQTAHQETQASFRSQWCRGKGHRHHPGSHHLTLSVQVLFYTWVRRRERGEGKCYACCKAELMSSRFVRVLSPIGHHTLPTWKNGTEINANNFWPQADVAFCSFSDVMWISKERCWTEVPRTLQHEA